MPLPGLAPQGKDLVCLIVVQALLATGEWEVVDHDELGPLEGQRALRDGREKADVVPGCCFREICEGSAQQVDRQQISLAVASNTGMGFAGRLA